MFRSSLSLGLGLGSKNQYYLNLEGFLNSLEPKPRLELDPNSSYLIFAKPNLNPCVTQILLPNYITIKDQKSFVMNYPMAKKDISKI